MSAHDCFDELAAILRDSEVRVALRREDATGLRSAVARLAPCDLAHAWFEGHAAQLAGDDRLAMAHYRRALTHLPAGAPPHCGAWLRASRHALQARTLAPDFAAAAAREDARLLYAHAAAHGSDLALAYAASLRAELFLGGPTAIATKLDYLEAIAVCDEAWLRADRATMATSAGARVEALESFAFFYTTTLRLLMRGQARGFTRDGAELAWRRFRALRLRADLRRDPDGRADAWATVPDGTAVLEFLALREEPLHVCLTTRGGRVAGVHTATVEEASRIQFELGEELRDHVAIAEPVAAATALCTWTHDSASRWSGALADSAVCWGDGATSTIDDRLATTGAHRVCILPHGPTCMVPWSLLSSRGGRSWLQRWELAISTSWRRGVRAPRPQATVHRQDFPYRGTETWPVSGDPGALLAPLAAHSRVWLSGHGTFEPPTHGSSHLTARSVGTRLELSLPTLLDAACDHSAQERDFPRSLWLSFCELGEVSRRTQLTELVTLAHAFAVAGAAELVAPKWSTTNFADARLPKLLAQPRSFAAIARDRFRAAHETWAALPVDCDRQRVERCRALGVPPLCDIGAFDVYAAIDQPCAGGMDMKIASIGRLPSGELALPFTSVDTLAQSLVRSWGVAGAPHDEFVEPASLQGNEQPRPIDDRADVRAAGWTYVVHERDPKRAWLEQAVVPLRARRNGAVLDEPLVYPGLDRSGWLDWLQREYFQRPLQGRRVPRYVLILGSPTYVPFALQSLLQTVAFVGRLDFDDEADMRAYVAKVLRLEDAPGPSVSREVTMFGTDGGSGDPTHRSARNMMRPLAKLLRDSELRVEPVIGSHATKAALCGALSARPAVVYTATHGLVAVDAPAANQRRYNGALCCADWDGGEDGLVTADDVPRKGKLLDGAAVFQFACNGYGTPATSDFAHLVEGIRPANPGEAFVAALPKRLLRRPTGPVAYFGHVDLAFVYGFSDPDEAPLGNGWHARLAPFAEAVRRLVTSYPCGQALETMHGRAAAATMLIADLLDDRARRKRELSPQEQDRLVEEWVIRNDARNYMLLGDPAVALRLPAA